MKDLKTYIDKNKFQFITSFERVEITNTKGENVVLDFGSLDIDERIFLSAFLTYVIQNEGVSGKLPLINLYDVVFNFNQNKRYITSYHQNYIDVISNFLRTHAHFVAYIIDHYKEIKENKTTIYRTQLNRSEMNLLYTLKFQRSFRSLLNVLYIMGVAKAATCTHKLNKIPLSRFYKDSVSMSKKRVAEIFNKLDIEYKILDDMVFFGNGFNVELSEQFYSNEKKDYDKIQKEMEILLSFGCKNDENKEAAKQVYEEIKNEDVISFKACMKELKEQEKNTPNIDKMFEETEETDDDDYAGEDFAAPVEDIDSIIDIGDGHFKWETFEKLNDFNHNEPYSLETEYAKMKEKFPKITGKALSALLVKYSLDINTLVRKNENIFKIFKGEQLGENWKEIKDNARVELLNIQNAVCNGLSKLYDNNYEIYKYIVLYLITTQKKTLTFKF